MQDLGSPTRNQPHAPASGVWSLNYWTFISMKVQRSLESYSCMTIEDQLSHRVFHLQRREQCLGDAEGTAGEILHTPEPELMQSVGNPGILATDRNYRASGLNFHC